VIKANVTEIKNRLSYYLRLVKGGEEIEIVDRKTPLARIVGLGKRRDSEKGASWVKEMYDLGIVMPPKKTQVSSSFLSVDQVILSEDDASGVLEALLEERDEGL
jgi:prevent-host-death family protein